MGTGIVDINIFPGNLFGYDIGSDEDSQIGFVAKFGELFGFLTCGGVVFSNVFRRSELNLSRVRRWSTWA